MSVTLVPLVTKQLLTLADIGIPDLQLILEQLMCYSVDYAAFFSKNLC